MTMFKVFSVLTVGCSGLRGKSPAIDREAVVGLQTEGTLVEVQQKAEDQVGTKRYTISCLKFLDSKSRFAFCNF